MKPLTHHLKILLAVLAVGVLPLFADQTGKKKEGGGVWIVPNSMASAGSVMATMENESMAQATDIGATVTEGISFKLPSEMVGATGVMLVPETNHATPVPVVGFYSKPITTNQMVAFLEESVTELHLVFTDIEGRAVGVIIRLRETAGKVDIFIF